ncbi:MAG: alcohol dehydrogenase [Rhodospirillaceae bacterium]|nr:MAG: alcohol dehydrogenase [Rhodospirillaceae bacterium]
MRVTKTVGQYYIGEGAIDHLETMIDVRLEQTPGSVLFLMDHYFKSSALVKGLPVRDEDALIFVDSTHEPTTDQLDALTGDVRALEKMPAVIVAIGGGSTLDIGKGMANLLTNGGKSEDYQGWDLVKVPGIFKIGVPTLSGTGAEGSRTCVLMNHSKNLKLGMNSDFTVYDRLILDPNLTDSVPKDQYFYSGMDTYIHCIESLQGRFRNAFADACSDQALKICRDIFLSDDMQSLGNREQMMVASFLGGSAIGNSFVGLVHPLSAGLSMVLGLHHCVANCIVMNVMDEFYPQETKEFKTMAKANGVDIPQGVCAELDEQQMQQLFDASIVHEKPLVNALGDDFKEILTFKKVSELFRLM